jgi:hypothetical protein
MLPAPINESLPVLMASQISGEDCQLAWPTLGLFSQSFQTIQTAGSSKNMRAGMSQLLGQTISNPA